MSTLLSGSTVPTTYNVCQTAACIETAKSLLNFIDLNADPCSDFYQYTCGAWLKENSDQDFMTPFDDAEQVIAGVLHDILEGEYQDLYKNLKDGDAGFHTIDEQEADKANFQAMKDYYNLCMDTATLDELGPTPIYPEIVKIQNSIFPVNKDQMYSSQQLNQMTDILVYLSRIGIYTLYTLDITQNFRNSNEIAIIMKEPALTLGSKQAYEDPESVAALNKEFVELLTLIIGESSCKICDEVSKNVGLQLWSTEKIQSAVDNFIAIEIALANISSTAVEQQVNLYASTTVSLTDFQNENILIDWKSYFKAMMLPGTVTPETIFNSARAYFNGLNQLLSHGIDMIYLQDYFIISYITSFADSLHSEPRSVFARLNDGLSSGDSTADSRWRDCVSNTNNVFESMIGRYYTLRAFGSEAERNRSEAFINAIHNSWRETIPATTWLDDQTRAKAMEKLNLIKHKAAYPTVSPDIRSPVSISQYYDGLKPNQTSFFYSQVKQKTWHTTWRWKQIGKPVDKNIWGDQPQTVNAYYDPSNNEILFPAGIQQPIFYSNSYPDYLNYGGAGAAVSHEISHGFDNYGRLFDGQGNRVDWWTDATTKEFDTRAQCFIEQYSKFNVSGPDGPIQVNGQLTLGENIADNGGIAASFRAYQSLRPNNAEPEPRLPGLEHLSPEQLFFISFGRIWCLIQSAEDMASSIETDTHSPSSARVNGMVQNSVEFSKAFNCPSRSPMNPETKCKIW